MSEQLVRVHHSHIAIFMPQSFPAGSRPVEDEIHEIDIVPFLNFGTYSGCLEDTCKLLVSEPRSLCSSSLHVYSRTDRIGLLSIWKSLSLPSSDERAEEHVNDE
ncbi:hypothetical protein PHSY_005520 [Pseudozyma hubeiensis SY62]|uniref:Uncharacterized protein n=1 Tax=Pseudozyma hubeiensis (strain SY62) TaxID=1305764 RepID=R9P9L7_PSEHS|nr:hypothetical protein PHSY_005520 [Pseudozyma hubeiensis SY62]GAC97932.1 hypothetical protein PHSY_005520 [Pseudozyma hubeiensis SY62]